MPDCYKEEAKHGLETVIGIRVLCCFFGVALDTMAVLSFAGLGSTGT